MNPPIAWLLEGEPWIEYRTRLDLLRQSENDLHVRAARKSMLANAGVQALVAELSGWPGTVISSHKSATYQVKGDESMTNFSFWQRWLFVVGIAVSVFGLFMAFFCGTPLFEAFNRQIDPAFWGTNVVENSAREFQKWAYGVWGATIAGWGISVTFMAHYPFRNKEKWAWNCLVMGMLVWFVLDTSLSVYYKVYFNAAFNTVLLILTMLPVILTRKYFAK